MPASVNQQKCIDTIDKPIIISAGAGSGKTFTLTERIVSSLMPDENGKRKIDGITSVVAITFTHKAAEELKSRIRHRLNECGLFEEALLVDDAYISTIHGFAARILKENALQFCISPKIELIDESAEAQYLREAFKLALSGASQGIVDREKTNEMLSLYSECLEGQDIEEIDIADFIDKVLDASKNSEAQDLEDQNTDKSEIEAEVTIDVYHQDKKIDEYVEDEAKLMAKKIFSIFKSLGVGQEHKNFDDFLQSFENEEGMLDIEDLFEMSLTLLNKCSTLPQGTSAFFENVDYLNAGELCKKLRTRMRAAIRQLASQEKLNKTEDKYLSTLQMAESNLTSEIDSWFHEDMYGSYDQDFIDALRACANITNKFHSDRDDSDFWKKFRVDLGIFLLEFLCEKNIDNLEQLALVCKNVEILESAIKGGKYFSNNDLLKYCYNFLKQYPEIAKEYKDKFKMIMIDEFQDTDRLQLSLIKEIAQTGLKNVCTVGDLQQSIYRFRSADVKVFREYRQEIEKKKDNLVISLDDNYRSHGDILALTDKIFGNEYFFGKEFLHLNAKGKINEIYDPIFEDRPRVRIDVVHNKTINKTNPDEKCSNSQAREYQAKKIAMHFKELMEEGCKPSSFALLLGKMTYAKVYQDALLDVGIESLISGGSIFKNSLEANNVRHLVNLARNFLDDTSLLAILKSDILNLSEDSILCISRKIYDKDGEKTISKCSLSSNIFTLNEELMINLSDIERDDIAFAQKLLTEYISNIESKGLVESIRTFLTSAGVFDKLQNMGPEGLVAAGNYEKSLYILSDISTIDPGICAIQEKYNSYLDLSNEKPGVLTSSKSNFMEIMTIHASKGLEFDHVAIAELPYREPRIDKFIAYNTKDKTYFSLLPNPDFYNLKDVADKLLKKFDDFKEADAVKLKNGLSAGRLHQSLMKLERDELLEEQKRLLYVAITRAVKSVFVSIQVFKSPPKDDYNNCGVVTNLYNVFKWDKDSTRYTNHLEFGGSSPLEFNYEFLPYSSSYIESQESTSLSHKHEGNTWSLPIRESFAENHDYIEKIVEDKYYSYSTLAEFSDDDYLLFINNLSKMRFAIAEDDDKFAYPYDVDSDKATDFGTVFHSFMERLVMQKSSLDDVSSDIRLRQAVLRTISSKEFEHVVALPSFFSEMPFFITIGQNNKFLRGSIDLVGIDENRAFILDYKTGTKPKDHSLQGKIYAYALLNSGISSIDIDFLHCEIPESEGSEHIFVQHLNFSKEDICDIEKDILECIQKSTR